MAKTGFAVIYVLLAALILSFIFRLGKSKSKKVLYLKMQLGLFVIADVTYILSYFTRNIQALSLIHCLILVMEVWGIFLLLLFGMEYAKVNRTPKKYVSLVAVLLSALDSVMIICQIIKGDMFSFALCYWQDTVSLKVELNRFYLCHFVIALFLSFLSICIFFYKAFYLPKLYRRKYVTIGTSILVTSTLCNIIRCEMDFVIFPVILFLAHGGIVYYVLYSYIPKQRELLLNDFVVENSVSPVLLFNVGDELQIFNPAAEKLLAVRRHMSMQEFISDSNLKYILTEERRKQGKTKEFTLTTQIEEQTYLIHGQELYDDRDRFIGTLFMYNDITGQEKLKTEMNFHATKDALTGMWNRDFFFEVAEKEISENPDISYIMIASNVHEFMMFNEILGMKTGDDVLISIANGYQEKKREHWHIGRIAGGRFAMIMPKADFEEEKFSNFAQEILGKRGYSLKVHVYFGIYEVVDYKLSPNEMYARAYMALESIKGNLNYHVAYFDEKIRRDRLKELITVDELEKAMKEREFVVFLQPQMDSVTNKVVGSEALVRWMSKTKGMVPPMEFIPLLENNGMITKLDYYVWEEVCRILKRWKEEGHTERTISVNISAKDFYLTDLYGNITGLVEKYGISPRNIKLEITETAFVLDVFEQASLVNRFRDYGFTIEIDDFGSGYSTLNSLKDIDVDVLKLDMKFFERSANPMKAKKIVESVIALAYNLNMPVVAEGVEKEEDVKQLQNIGCDIIQGYYYAKPMPVEDFEKFIGVYPFEDFSEIYYRMRKRIEDHAPGKGV